MLFIIICFLFLTSILTNITGKIEIDDIDYISTMDDILIAYWNFDEDYNPNTYIVKVCTPRNTVLILILFLG